MEHHTNRFESILRNLQIIVQIVAIIIAGIWTYMKFIRTEAPLFENTISVQRSLSDPIMKGNECERTFSINFINTGKTTFYVEKVVTRGWKFRLARSESEFVKVVDLDEIEKNGKQVFSQMFPSQNSSDNSKWYPFIKKYRPGENYSHGFNMLLKNESGAWIYLKTEIFVRGEKTPAVGGVWGRVCGDNQSHRLPI